MSTIIAAVKTPALQAILVILGLGFVVSRATGAEHVHGADGQFAFLDRYCSDCHNEIEFRGKVAFDSMTPGAITSSNPGACPSSNVTASSATGLSLPVGANATSGAQSIANVVSMDNGAPDGCQGVTFTIALTLTGSQD